MAVFEPTKGLAVIACDENATIKLLPAKVLHVDKKTFDDIMSGKQTLEAKVENGYLVLSVPQNGGNVG